MDGGDRRRRVQILTFIEGTVCAITHGSLTTAFEVDTLSISRFTDEHTEARRQTLFSRAAWPWGESP